MSEERPADRLARRVASREATVAVIGLGYAGLPVAFTFAEGGFQVLGLDIDEAKIHALRTGRCYIAHLGSERLAGALGRGRFEPSHDFGRLAQADAIVVAVPTPLTPQRDPDLAHVVATARTIAAHLRPGQLVVLESTSYPGTTDEVVRPILEATGLKAGADFFLAFSPEREDPGNRQYTTATIPKVVGGVDPVSTQLAAALYGAVVERVVPVSDARTAEATKLYENVFRAVNIALVNELKLVLDRMGIDVWEVLDAAATKPFGLMRFDPGPGWGGHCIPVDPFYLAWKAREYGVTARFIEHAGEVNARMPEHVVDKLVRALGDRGVPMRGARILLLGVAYKRDVDDARESPAFEIMKLLLDRGAVVDYHDPHVPRMPVPRRLPSLPALSSTPLRADVIAARDALIVVTDHTSVDYELVARHARLVVDTRGVLRGRRPNVVQA
ncbi:MAG: nucleotide sugar dehydrogenase [Myxococcota bacterium]|nr:nucleotide sugar dehydrogenase [Myxococcota bacterium]MDW8362825.1 nucleotide sugar dehydrogenase [Myxococcales bacterium]